MFIIAGVWIFQVSSNSQWGNGRNRMMMGWMYKFTLFFMPYSNSHVLKVHGTYYCTFCAMCLVTESKQTPFIYIIQGLLYRWTVHLADFPFLNSDWGRKKGPQITPPGFIFWIMIFYNLKNFRSRSIYSLGSKFILSSLEVGHWAAQTQAFFDKLQSLTKAIIFELFYYINCYFRV